MLVKFINFPITALLLDLPDPLDLLAPHKQGIFRSGRLERLVLEILEIIWFVVFLLYGVSVSVSLTSLSVQTVLSVFHSVFLSVFRTPRSHFPAFPTELSQKTGIYSLNPDTSDTFYSFFDRAVPEISLLP